MHARKTGALIRASAVSGAIMAGATADVVSAIDRYATDVGLAFQIVDDILDVEGQAEQLGKTAGKDAKQGKPTYVSAIGLPAARRLADELRQEAQAAIAELGTRASRLAELADFIVLRKF